MIERSSTETNVAGLAEKQSIMLHDFCQVMLLRHSAVTEKPKTTVMRNKSTFIQGYYAQADCSAVIFR